jgi:hypothetical protein
VRKQVCDVRIVLGDEDSSHAASIPGVPAARVMRGGVL